MCNNRVTSLLPAPELPAKPAPVAKAPPCPDRVSVPVRSRSTPPEMAATSAAGAAVLPGVSARWARCTPGFTLLATSHVATAAIVPPLTRRTLTENTSATLTVCHGPRRCNRPCRIGAPKECARVRSGCGGFSVTLTPAFSCGPKAATPSKTTRLLRTLYNASRQLLGTHRAVRGSVSSRSMGNRECSWDQAAFWRGAGVSFGPFPGRGPYMGTCFIVASSTACCPIGSTVMSTDRPADRPERPNTSRATHALTNLCPRPTSRTAVRRHTELLHSTRPITLRETRCQQCGRP
ncbi:hypothetical protein RCH22_002971 [Cryobacterium psychrotolerans]|nr:hypothetical protein [Cryobacterium psychrotolerans]